MQETYKGRLFPGWRIKKQEFEMVMVNMMKKNLLVAVRTRYEKIIIDAME